MVKAVLDELDKELERAVARLGKFHSEAAGPQVMPELLAEQHLNIRLVIDHQYQQAHNRPPLRRVLQPCAAG